MLRATATLDPAFRVAPVSRRTFGSFVEHLGRCVYTGIHEPGHPTADADGFRGDVLALTRELGVSTVRYPGGNFVSGYRWEDGVGPVEQRPRRRDLAWHTTEPNTVGLDEFVRWTRKAEVEPMLAINLGTRGVAEALDILEYANMPAGTALADQRVENGSKEPHGIRMWCLGNEMDGPWQIGHKTAAEYGRLAAETANAMRMMDRNLELVACGSSNSRMPTFASWEAEVLEQAYHQVDFVSLHAYYEPVDGDVGSFLASNADMDRMIEAVIVTADHVGAKLRSKKKIMLSFDEWNVWYQSRFHGIPPLEDWPVAPRQLEDVYDVTDAVVVGSLLISLLRHSDRVTSAAQAQLVNVIAPIMTEPGGPAWRQTIFHPFALTSRHARGEVLRIEPDSPRYETARYGDVPVLDAVATWDEEAREASVFAVNRDQTQPLTLEVDVRALPVEVVREALTVADDDRSAHNTAQQPDRVVPRPNGTARLADGRLQVELPPVSWSMLRLGVQA